MIEFEDKDFTICCLCFGDHPDLAKRMLDSIRAHFPVGKTELRIGLNAPSKTTQSIVARYRADFLLNYPANIHKYPMMRQLFWRRPIQTKYVMWFDDDSFIRPDAVDFRKAVLSKMDDHDMIGGIYLQKAVGNQNAWVRDQPWYQGKDPAKLKQFKFITGGWWTLRTQVIEHLQYPWKSLDHRGGDVMLGEALRQNAYKLGQFNKGVAINADEAGAQCRARRRGFDSPPIGHNYIPNQEPPPSQRIIPV